MAINWDLNITNVNVQTSRATVTATRTDSESALPPQTYSFQQTPIGPADRVGLLNTIKQKVEEDAAKQVAVDAIITDLEQAGKAALETWEATR